MQFTDLDQPEIGRNAVARSQNHDITGDQLFGGYGSSQTVPDHHRLLREHVADSIEGLLSLAFLNEADEGVDDDHTDDYPGVDPVT